MPAPIAFYRNNFSLLWIDIRSNEQLGILDTAFIEDYNGVDGAVTLVRLSDDYAYSVPMSAVPGQTPETPDDYFRGSIALNTLPDGIYEVRGRVKDLAGNYSVMGSVASPLGTERIFDMQIRIISGSGSKRVVDVGAFTVRGAYLVDVGRDQRVISAG
jgi:hypothetical protein